MIEDHGKANDELKKIAGQKKLALPTELEPEHQNTVKELEKLSGAYFDQQYMQEMVKDHTKDVAEFRNAGKTLKDPDLKAWAEKTLPVLESHLEQARGVAQKVGVDVNKA
jgi:putative membrane protein